jgi:hypothetical protein
VDIGGYKLIRIMGIEKRIRLLLISILGRTFMVLLVIRNMH